MTDNERYSWRGEECVITQQKFVGHQSHGWVAHLEATLLKYLYRYPRKTPDDPESDLLKFLEYAVLLALAFIPGDRVKDFLVRLLDERIQSP